MVAGVAAGIAARLNVDPVLVRLGFVVLSFLNGFGLVLYLVMWLLIPSDVSVTPGPREQVRENMGEMRDAAEGLVQRVRSLIAPNS
jgi:phage shock protein PspC (stress-responsive transcriptional regulator)